MRKARATKKNIGSLYNCFKLTDSEKWPKHSSSFNTYKLFLPPNLGKAFPTMCYLGLCFPVKAMPNHCAELWKPLQLVLILSLCNTLPSPKLWQNLKSSSVANKRTCVSDDLLPLI